MPRNMERNPPQHGVDHDQGQEKSDAHNGQEIHLPLNQSVSDSLTGDPANILTPTSYLNLNTSATMASVLECMTLQQSPDNRRLSTKNRNRVCNRYPTI